MNPILALPIKGNNMNTIKKMLKFLRNDEAGAVTIEYVAIAVIVGALALTAMTTVQSVVTGRVAELDITP
jgi:Flp pilus assembly pilin Flp